MKHAHSAFLAGSLTGALVGAALAMVLTPRIGAGMREMLRAKAYERSADE